MFRSALVFIFFVLIGFTGFMTFHLGVWKGVNIQKKTYPDFILLYKEHMGPYHKTVSAIEEVEKWAQANNIDCRLSFGKYLDDPQATEEARLRSWGGCLILNPSKQSAEAFNAALPKHPGDFKIEGSAEREFVIAEFTGSPGIGPMKVYPKVAEFMEQARLRQSGPVIEIYEILDRAAKREMKTTYLFPF